MPDRVIVTDYAPNRRRGLLWRSDEDPGHDDHLKHLADGFAAVGRWKPETERVVLPMLEGPVEDAAAGMAALNNSDWMQMTESERQPYREQAASMLIAARKERALAQIKAEDAQEAGDG